MVSSPTPAQFRALAAQGLHTSPTAGICPGYAQANLIILPTDAAKDFQHFAALNPFSCPVLEQTKPGQHISSILAPGDDILTTIPRYRIYHDGHVTEEVLDASPYWQEGMVCFLIGCSFSFEEALLQAGLPVRHIEEGSNVPMYRTSIPCTPYGIFSGSMVVSMRPMLPEQAKQAAEITAQFPRVHGAPIHSGDPSVIGIADINKPDYGEAVTIRPGEIPVFWPCGVTPQAAVEQAKPSLAIGHAPGHMLVSDILNATLATKAVIL